MNIMFHNNRDNGKQPAKDGKRKLYANVEKFTIFAVLYVMTYPAMSSALRLQGFPRSV